MACKEKYKEDTWYDAPSRKGKQGESSKQKGYSFTKYFVSNLPNGCASSDLVEVLKGFGKIHNTYIARKYDKLGKRFGFVMFVDVRDPVGLENDMRDVWIGSYKLFIALARFVDGEKLNWNGDKKWIPANKENNKAARPNVDVRPEPVVEVNNMGNAMGDGRSFKDSLLKIVPPVDKKRKEFIVDAEVKGCLLWEGCGAVGRLLDFAKLPKLRKWLDLVGQTGVGIRYVGGIGVEVCLEGFLNTSEVWRVCFQSLVKWDGQPLPRERVVWIKIFGLPLGLYDNGLVNDIGSLYGKVVHSTDVSESVVDLSHIMVGVLCDPGVRINEILDVKWKEEVYSVLVEEEFGEWVPECLEDTFEFSEVEVNASVDRIGNVEVVEDGFMEGVELDGDTNENGMENMSSNLDTRGDGEVRIDVNGGLYIDTTLVGDKVELAINKIKKPRGFRKKDRSQKSPSPQGQERPKKRAREGDDLFDIDRFIFNVNGKEEGGRDKNLICYGNHIL